MYHSRIAGNAAKRCRWFSYVYVAPRTLFVGKKCRRFSQFSTNFLSKGIKPVLSVYYIPGVHTSLLEVNLVLCVGQRLCLWAPMNFKCHGMARGLRHGAHGAHGGHVWQTDSEK